LYSKGLKKINKINQNIEYYRTIKTRSFITGVRRKVDHSEEESGMNSLHPYNRITARG
jgi:hypothetical protein